MTSRSLLGQFGKTAKEFAHELMGRGLVHFLASDAHDTRKRPPLLRKALEAASSLVGKEQALAMVTVTPGKIIRGEPWV